MNGYQIISLELKKERFGKTNNKIKNKNNKKKCCILCRCFNWFVFESIPCVVWIISCAVSSMGNPHLPNILSHPYQLDESIFHLRDVWCIFFFFIIFLWAKSVDPDQTPRSAASDLGLHCLPMSQKWDARRIWVKAFVLFSLSNVHPVVSLKQNVPYFFFFFLFFFNFSCIPDKVFRDFDPCCQILSYIPLSDPWNKKKKKKKNE